MSRYTLIYMLVATLSIVCIVVLGSLGMRVIALWLTFIFLVCGIVDFCFRMRKQRK